QKSGLSEFSKLTFPFPFLLLVPCQKFLELGWIALGAVMPPLPIYCGVFNIGLVGPWAADPLLAKACPQVAAQLALERIKRDPSINDGPPLDCSLLKEDCRTCNALAGLIDHEKQLSAFIGPLNPGYCDSASLLARSWNKAIFSWACISDDLDNPSYHPTFTRTLPSPTGILLTVLKYFKWAHVGIIFSKEELWMDTANKLAVALRNQGIRVSAVTSTEKGDENAEGTWAEIKAAGNIKVVILCMHSALIGGEVQAALLSRAQEMGLADGRFVFLPYDTLFYSLPHRNQSYFILENDRPFREAYDSVLTITLQSGEQTFYEAFRAAKQKGEIDVDLEPQQVSPLFGTIYDAVYLVAKALAKAHRQGTTDCSGATLTQHVKNLDFAGFNRRVQADSKGRPVAKYVILDSDRKGSQLAPVFLLNPSSGSVHSLGRAVHFPGGRPPPDFASVSWDYAGIATDTCGNPNIVQDNPGFILHYKPPVYPNTLSGYSLRKCALSHCNPLFQFLSRHNSPYAQVVKGSKKLLLTLDDLSFLNPEFSRTVGHELGADHNLNCNFIKSNAFHKKGPRSGFFPFWYPQMKDMHHENVNPFLGLLSDGDLSAFVMEFCSRGSLEDLLQNTDIKLDWMFKSSLIVDLISGMKYLHHQGALHGRLKSRNCLVDGRFVLKVTDYGYSELLSNPLFLVVVPSELLWTAPELLRASAVYPKGTLKGDVFSFAIILQEVILRGPPYCMSEISAEEIIRKLRKPPPLYRPSVSLENAPLECIQLMKQCWSEVPERRPTFDEIFQEFKAINKGRRINIVDSMLRMLEQYSSNLEELIQERTEELELEKRKTEGLLTQMLPPSVAETLKTGAAVEPEYFEEVSIYFSDIIGFTTISALSEPIEIVQMLNDLYSLFDAVLGSHDVYKVETIGDAYMVVSGLPKRIGHRHAAEIANMALDILSSVGSFKVKHLPGVPIRIRMGLHSGPCAAGVVGLTMPRYCLFGDTVNTASRIESTGLPYRIHISKSTMKILRRLNEGYKIDFRGKTELKGKGLEETYWLVGKRGFTKPLPRPPEMKPGGHQPSKRHLSSLTGKSPPSPEAG
uniref:Guanylate cyclase n=1 Tax=Salvator merianae TaxID=96440 RepID=A0A8D0BTE5_SALMN